MILYDTWAVSPSAVNATLIRAAAAVAGAGAVSILSNDVSVQGCGYKLLFTSVGNSSGMSFTIVGDALGKPGKTTEVLTGPNATTGTTTNYWVRIDSVTASAAATGNISIGITGSLALPRTRIRGVHYVGAAAAGTMVIALNTAATVLLNIDTPASATFAEMVGPISVPTYNTTGALDFAVVTLTQVAKCTLICG